MRRLDLDRRHAVHRDDRLGDVPIRIACASGALPVGAVWDVADAAGDGDSARSPVHPGAWRGYLAAAGHRALLSLDPRLPTAKLAAGIDDGGACHRLCAFYRACGDGAVPTLYLFQVLER